MNKKPLITISGKKSLLDADLHQRIIQDISQEGIEWRRRLDTNVRSVYIDIDLVEFKLQKTSPHLDVETSTNDDCIIGDKSILQDSKIDEQSDHDKIQKLQEDLRVDLVIGDDAQNSPNLSIKTSSNMGSSSSLKEPDLTDNLDDHKAFFNRRLLGQPILHTYWADKTDFEVENKKSQFETWIGQVQASNCTEWAIIIIEDGDFKAQLGTALFKSKLQSSTSQANTSSSSLNSSNILPSSLQSSQSSGTSSFLDRMKKSLSTMFNNDANSDRWLTLMKQQDNSGNSRSANETNKAQESYTQFIRKFRNIIMTSFSKQIELFEEQLRVQREIRNDKNWDFFNYFSMQEELAFAYEFLTLFDEALMQYDLLDALFTEHLRDESQSSKQWKAFDYWHALCLDLNNEHYSQLRKRIVDKEASLLDLRNYLFAKQCDLMLLQNQPWRVAASTIVFLHNCIREHERLNINCFEGALDCWAFISALEVLQKCECYSCTSTMENYSYHTVDIWNYARKKLLELGDLFKRMPGNNQTSNLSGSPDPNDEKIRQHMAKLFEGLGPDPHGGTSCQKSEISPQARLKDALCGSEQFSKHLIELSELTLGTYKHIGRKRHALLIGKELAEFYLNHQNNFQKALPFLIDMERMLKLEKWTPLIEDVQSIIAKCNDKSVSDKNELKDQEKQEQEQQKVAKMSQLNVEVCDQ